MKKVLKMDQIQLGLLVQWRLLAAAIIVAGDREKKTSPKDAVELVDGILFEMEEQNKQDAALRKQIADLE